MRSERLYLKDIVEASDDITEFLIGISEAEFKSSKLLQSAVVQKLAVIGEACSKISDATKAKYPEIPWRKAVTTRHFLVHVYFNVELPILWETVTHDVPDLRVQISKALDREYSREDAESTDGDD